MWISTLDLDPKRVLITQLLRRIWSGATFSALAPLQMQNLPRQSLPEKTWVRVRNRLAGICGSDLHMIQGDGDLRIAPAALPLHRHSYPGHEVVGEVLEVGEDVQRIRVGDRVVLQYGPNCISTGVQTPCSSCSQGYYNLCEYGQLPGPSPLGGGWSEEMLLSEQQLFRLPADISDEQAVLLEPTAVAVHAVLRRPPQQGEQILIIGAGAIGLLTLQVVRALAPQAEVSVLARHSFQIEQATRMGAAHIIYTQDSYTGIQRATNAQLYKGAFGNQTLLGGYDVIFDTVGNQNTLHNALRWARTRATVVLVGVNLHLMRIDLTPVWYQEVNLIGTVGSSVENWPLATNERRSTFEVALELIKHNQIQPEHLITHRFPLNNYQTALLTAAGKAQSHAIKVVFDYSLLPPSVVPNVRASAARKRRPTLPIDESTSAPENETTQEGVPPSAQPTEPAIAMPLSSLFSSSQTVAPLQQEDDDEFDEMEDTMPALAIVKYNKQTPAPAIPSPESEATPPTFFEQDTLENDEISSEQETEVYPITSVEHIDVPAEDEQETEVHPIASTEHMDVPVEDEQETEVHPIASTEHMDVPVEDEQEIASTSYDQDILQEEDIPSEQETEPYSETTIEIHAIQPEEPSEVQIDEVAPVTLESVEADQYNSEHPEAPVAKITNDPSETSEEAEAEITADPPETSEEAEAEITADPPETSEEELTIQPATSEFPEPATQTAQEASSSPDLALEEKTDAGNATGETENTLLFTEEPATVKVQNRPRPRTRKKNNRAAVERR